MAGLRGSIFRRYARALFDLGVERQSFEALGRELRDFADLVTGTPELRQALDNPMFRPAEKRAIIEQILPRVAPSPLSRSFVLLLLERGRIGVLPRIARAYDDLVDARLGRVRATVVSARPLDPATAEDIRRSIERRTGKQVIMTKAVDPSLMGGAVARVGGLIFDGSLRARLEVVRSRMLA